MANDNDKWKNGLLIVSGIGLLLSVYSYHVESSMEEDENYSAMCDINEKISCTKVFGSMWVQLLVSLIRNQMVSIDDKVISSHYDDIKFIVIR